MKFRKKPVVIEAMQFDGENTGEIIMWAHEGLPPIANSIITPDHGPTLMIRTLEGYLHGVKGDWIIRGVKGEFYPCKPDIFALTYEPESAQPEVAAICTLDGCLAHEIVWLEDELMECMRIVAPGTGGPMPDEITHAIMVTAIRRLMECDTDKYEAVFERWQKRQKRNEPQVQK